MKKASTWFVSLALAALAVLIGAAPEAEASNARVAELKARIRSVAWQNMSRTDNRAMVRTELDGLIAELHSLATLPQGDEFVRLNAGSWQQIWADESNPEPPGFTQDFSQVYQTIAPEGFGYNFGVRGGPQGRVTFILRVQATVQGNVATPEITNAYGRAGELAPGEDLMALSYRIESGNEPTVVERAAGRFPRGPIGAKSPLTVLFLDADLKIGVAPNSYSGFRELFVMERTMVPRFR
jgi:hypothetical protein